jgi:hypothetical protein
MMSHPNPLLIESWLPIAVIGTRGQPRLGPASWSVRRLPGYARFAAVH